MNPTPEHIYKKIDVLSREIKEQFLEKGIVIPSTLPDGSVKIGKYLIKKNRAGFYSVTRLSGDPVAEMINLPQTAILVANGLALGKWRDDDLLTLDRDYGYAHFEEDVQKRRLTNAKDTEKMCLSLAKISDSRLKKEQYKKSILDTFEKLRKLT